MAKNLCRCKKRLLIMKTDKINEEVQQEAAEQEVEVTAQESAESVENADKTAAASTEEKEEDLLAKAQAEVADLKDKNLRMMAEFDNYRRRTAKEKLDIQKTAGEGIFTDMLALVDDFERAEKAMAESDDVEALRQGMDLIYKKFIAFLEKNEVKEIAAEKGEDFNVDFHEAITTFPAGDDQKGKIIDCTQKGYTLGEKVIRYAKVVVGE